jgi:hypothetical protein
MALSKKQVALYDLKLDIKMSDLEQDIILGFLMSPTAEDKDEYLAMLDEIRFLFLDRRTALKTKQLKKAEKQAVAPKKPIKKKVAKKVPAKKTS